MSTPNQQQKLLQFIKTFLFLHFILIRLFYIDQRNLINILTHPILHLLIISTYYFFHRTTNR